MKKYFYVFIMSCLFFSCTYEQLPNLPPESPSKSRTFAERLIVDSAVYEMLQEQEEFYDICEQAYKMRDLLNVMNKDSIQLASILSVSKQIGSEYEILNKKFEIDNIQMYIIEYLNSSISYSKSIIDTTVIIEDIIVNSNLSVAWNYTFMNIHQLLQGYNDMDYEVDHFQMSVPMHGCVVKYWYRYHLGEILEEDYHETIGYILGGCGMPSSSYSLSDVWTNFRNYYMMYPPPYGSKPRPDPDPGDGDGGGGNPDPGGGGEDPDKHPKCKYDNENCNGNPCICCEICQAPCTKCKTCHREPCVCIKEIDCDQEATNSSNKVTDKFELFKSAGAIEFIANYTDASEEYSVSLNRNFDDGYSMTEPRTDSHSDNVFQEISEMTVALMHNHPDESNPSPSMGDVKALIEANGFNEDIRTSYICAYDGSIFALYITNTVTAKTFYNYYKDVDFHADIQNVVKDIIDQTTFDMTPSEFVMYATAYVLQEKK